MWWVYFLVGFVLATYVFYVFLGSLRTLFLHEDQARRTDTPAPSPKGGNQS